jgi:hypothetical protein
MKLTSCFVYAVLAYICTAVPASALTIDISLTGTVSDGAYSSFDSGGIHYDQWALSLSGLSPVNVSIGDEIKATITLDQSFTIPPSVSLTTFLFALTGPSFPTGDTGTTGATSFYNSGFLVTSGFAGTSTSGQLANSVIFSPPDNGAITFDSVIADFTITELGDLATLETALMSYTLFSPSAEPVPEPSTVILLGAGVIGFALIRRKARKS